MPSKIKVSETRTNSNCSASFSRIARRKCKRVEFYRGSDRRARRRRRLDSADRVRRRRDFESSSTEDRTARSAARSASAWKFAFRSTRSSKPSFPGFTEPPANAGRISPRSEAGEVVITGHIEPAAVAPGGKAKLVITATPNPDWHVYAYATNDPDAGRRQQADADSSCPAAGLDAIAGEGFGAADSQAGCMAACREQRISRRAGDLDDRPDRAGRFAAGRSGAQRLHGLSNVQREELPAAARRAVPRAHSGRSRPRGRQDSAGVHRGQARCRRRRQPRPFRATATWPSSRPRIRLRPARSIWRRCCR